MIPATGMPIPSVAARRRYSVGQIVFATWVAVITARGYRDRPVQRQVRRAGPGRICAAGRHIQGLGMPRRILGREREETLGVLGRDLPQERIS